MENTDLKTLAASIDLAAVADALGLHPLGGRRRFCPSCQPGGGKSPDLVVRDSDGGDKGRWTCFKCGAHSDALDLIGLARGYDVKRSIDFLEAFGDRPASRPTHPAGGTVTPEAIRRALADFYSQAGPVPDTPAEAYWIGRGIPASLLESVGVRYLAAARLRAVHNLLAERHGMDVLTEAELAGVSREGKPYPSLWRYEREGLGLSVFPYLHGGDIVGLKVRPLIDKPEAERLNVPRFWNMGEAYLFNAGALADNSEVILTEGESDCLSALAAGHVAVGVPGAKVFQPEWTPLFSSKKVYLAFDGDKAGREATSHVAEVFRQAGLPVPWALPIPDGMDLAQYLMQPTSVADDPAALPEQVEELARAISRLCWQSPGAWVMAAAVEREGGLNLAASHRREIWSAVVAFYTVAPARQYVEFRDGKVRWNQN